MKSTIINFIVALIATMNMTAATPTIVEATIDRVEDGNIAVVEVYDPTDGNIYFGDVPAGIINGNVASSVKIPAHSIQVKCAGTFLDIYGNQYFHFTGDETWALSESELGFCPKTGELYTLYVSNNGTPEYIYDDVFICVKC